MNLLSMCLKVIHVEKYHDCFSMDKMNYILNDCEPVNGGLYGLGSILAALGRDASIPNPIDFAPQKNHRPSNHQDHKPCQQNCRNYCWLLFGSLASLHCHYHQFLFVLKFGVFDRCCCAIRDSALGVKCYIYNWFLNLVD